MSTPFDLDKDLLDAVKAVGKQPLVKPVHERQQGDILGKRPWDDTPKKKEELSEAVTIKPKTTTTPKTDTPKPRVKLKKAAVKPVSKTPGQEVKPVKSGNPGFGYHGEAQRVHGEKGVQAQYAKVHKAVMKHAGAQEQEAVHYLDSRHGRHLAGHENNPKYIRKDFKIWKKTYNPKDYTEK